jgi:transposase, IS5 family
VTLKLALRSHPSRRTPSPQGGRRRTDTKRFGAVYSDKAGHPPLPTRLMAGLSILKHMHNLSDEDLCARWVENPYYQLFCGEEFFQHKLTFDRSSLTRWR